MKVGSLVYAHHRGLGHLAKAFYDRGLIQEVIVVEHPGVPRDQSWYPGSQVMSLRNIGLGEASKFVDRMDRMVYFETPFDWRLIRHAPEKSYLIPMYECTPYPVPYEPGKWLCPSLLDLQYFMPEPGKRRSVFLPLPVDPRVVWKERSRAVHFIHNGGYLGLRGREGTRELIQALGHIKSKNIRLTIRVQENVEQGYIDIMKQYPWVEYIPENVPYEQLFSEGDVYVAPQKFNGCSLPLQEACASGLLVMTTNRFPMNTWLNNDPMIPVDRYQRARVGGRYYEFDEAVVEPRDIAATIDAWAGLDIRAYSLQGRSWGRQNGWDELEYLWRKEIET